MDKNIKTEQGLRGTVKRKIYYTARLQVLRDAIASGKYSRETLEALEKWASKPIFVENILFVILRKLFKVEVKIPFITGMYSLEAVRHNAITVSGLEKAMTQLSGLTTAPVTAIAIGTGTPGANALGTEVTTDGGQRGVATITQTTVSTTDDSIEYEKTFNFTGGPHAITEEGLFDNNTSGGNMFASQSFASSSLGNGDSLVITHTVTASQA